MIRPEIKRRLEELLADLNDNYEERCVYAVLTTLRRIGNAEMGQN